ncbi:hypothetical protein GKKCFE_19100 [Pseudomonas sp. E141]
MDCNTRTVLVVLTLKRWPSAGGGLVLGECGVSVGQRQEKRLNYLSDLCLVFGRKPYM